MKTITLKPTGEQKVYHKFYAPFIFTSDIDLPKMINRGYNTYAFTENVEFKVEGEMPLNKGEKVTNRLFKEQAEIIVMRKDGTSVSGFFYRSIFDGVVTEKFDFS